MRAIYTPKKIEPQAHLDHIDFGAGHRERSIESTLKTLTAISTYSDYLYYSPLGLFHHGRDPYRIARYIFLGPASGDAPIKLALFASLLGDEPQGTQAIVEFLTHLHLDPERGRGYQIFAYPISNPTGFEDGTILTRRGKNLPAELWSGSREPEAYYLERELGVLQFHGIIHLRTGLGNGIHAHVQGSPILTKALAQPALDAAEWFLPRDKSREGKSFFPTTTDGGNRYERGLSNPAELKPAPFELTFETPRKALPELQSRAGVAALNSVLQEYRPFLAAQENL